MKNEKTPENTPDPFGDFLKTQGIKVVDVTPRTSTPPKDSLSEERDWRELFDERFVVKSNAGTGLLRYTDADKIKTFIAQEIRKGQEEVMKGLYQKMKFRNFVNPLPVEDFEEYAQSLGIDITNKEE